MYTGPSGVTSYTPYMHVAWGLGVTSMASHPGQKLSVWFYAYYAVFVVLLTYTLSVGLFANPYPLKKVQVAIYDLVPCVG